MSADTDPYSCANKEEQSGRHDTNQVQGPMPSLPLHPRAQGLGQGGEAEAESATRYVFVISSSATSPLTLYPTVLTISETPKKNAKGKRVAKA